MGKKLLKILYYNKKKHEKMMKIVLENSFSNLYYKTPHFNRDNFFFLSFLLLSSLQWITISFFSRDL